MATILWLGDRTNKNPLYPDESLQDTNTADWFNATAGTVRRWRELGLRSVTRQPSAASPSALVLNTTVTDSVVVHVTGLAVNTAASGTADYLYNAEEFVEVNTTANFTTSTQWARVESVGKDDITAADLVVWDTSSNVVARLGKNDYRAEYREVELLFKPTAGTELELLYYTNPPAVATNAQVPHPAVDPQYLVFYAAGYMAQEQNQSTIAQLHMANAERILKRRIDKEKTHGERDYQALPDQRYWGSEDEYSVF